MAQVTVQGTVSDGVEYLPGVNVALFQDSSLVRLARTDSLGQYTLVNVAGGSYRLTCSLIGYDPFVSRVEVKGDRLHIDLAEILLHESPLELGAVEIRAGRLPVEQMLDRVVIRPGESVTSSGNTVLEVLQKAPGVVLNRQAGVISINGRAGVRVMINNKVMQLSGDVVLQMLDGMNSAQVERIELIESPTANYDAEGAGGIINIVMKETNVRGTSGSLALTAGARAAAMAGLSFNVTHRRERAVYFVDYSGSVNHNRHTMTMKREMNKGDKPITTEDHSPRENVTTQQNVNLGAEWEVGGRTKLNMLLTGYSRDWELDATAANTTIFNGDSVRESSMQVVESNVWRSATGSLGVQHQINASHRLDATIDYLFYQNDNPSHYKGNMPDADEIQLAKKTPIEILVVAAQYMHTDQQAIFSWDAGIKAVISKLNNNVTVDRLAQGVWHPDETLTTSATQHEQILASYVSTVWRPNPGWEVSAGLRYEYTHTDIVMNAEPMFVRRRYGNWFPQLSIRRQLSSGDEFFLSYNRRITRPTYNDMAPYVFFWGPGSFSSGNTILLPALTDMVTAGLHYGVWAWTFTYSHTGNAIAMMQPEMLAGSTLVLRSQNLNRLNTVALATSYSTQLFPWWDLRGDVTVQHQTAATGYLPHNFQSQLWGVNANGSILFKLPAQIGIELSGSYQSRSLSGASTFLPSGSLNAGISKQLGPRSTLKLAADDLLYTNLWRIRTSSPENDLNVAFNYDFHNRFVRLSYTWTPGNNKVRGAGSRYSSEEERQRVNP